LRSLRELQGVYPVLSRRTRNGTRFFKSLCTVKKTKLPKHFSKQVSDCMDSFSVRLKTAKDVFTAHGTRAAKRARARFT
jgi:hypothetical protein